MRSKWIVIACVCAIGGVLLLFETLVPESGAGGEDRSSERSARVAHHENLTARKDDAPSRGGEIVAVVPESDEPRREEPGGRSGGSLSLVCRAACGPEPFTWPELLLSRDGGAESTRRRAAPSMRWDGLRDGAWTLELVDFAWSNGPSSVRIVDGECLEHELVLQPRCRYAGQLVDAETLAPIEEAQVEPSWRPGGSVPGYVTWLPVDLSSPDGRFCLTGAREPAESVQFRFTASGHRNASTDWLPGAEGTVVEDLLVLMERQRLVRLFGVVRGAGTGEVLPGALLCVLPEHMGREQILLDGEHVRFMGMAQTLEDLTEVGYTEKSDEGGSWSIEVDTPSRLRVCAILRGRLVTLSDVLDLPAGASDRELDISLELGATLKGRVNADPESSEIVPTSVVLADAGGSQIAACALAKDWTFEMQGLAEGAYRLDVFGELVRAERALPTLLLASEQVDVRPEQINDVEVWLGSARPGRSLRGQFIAPVGVDLFAVIGAVCVHPELGPPCALTVVETQGSFALHGIPLEHSTVDLVVDALSADGKDRAFVLVRVDAQAVALDPVRIDVTQSCVEIECSSEGRVPSGERLRIVAVQGSEGHPWLGDFLDLSLTSRVEFAPGARYRLFGLPAGDYWLRGESVEVPFTVGTGTVRVLVQ